MNHLIVVLLIATALVDVNGYCYGAKSELYDGDRTKWCWFKGYYIGNGKRRDLLDICETCSCDEGMVHCCQIGGTFTSYPSDCRVIPDGPCRQKVVQKDDANKACTGPISGVGR